MSNTHEESHVFSICLILKPELEVSGRVNKDHNSLRYRCSNCRLCRVVSQPIVMRTKMYPRHSQTEIPDKLCQQKELHIYVFGTHRMR